MSIKNTMKEFDFIIAHICWSLIVMIWYKNLLFKCLKGKSYSSSKLILIGILVLCIFIGLITTYTKRRNWISIITNIMIPYGIYSLLAYFYMFRNFILIVMCAAFLLSSIFIILIMGRKIPNRRRFKQIVKKRIEYTFTVIKNIFACGMAVIMFSFGSGLFFRSSLMHASVTPAIDQAVNEQFKSNYIDVMTRLQEDVWKSLSVKERLDVLQTVANIEQQYLGIPNELNVGTENLEETLLGYYNDSTHEIIINLDYIASGSSLDLLNVICHEAFHSYQIRIVDIYNGLEKESKNLKLFRKVDFYEKEFHNYISGRDDFCSYYKQNCEKDARNYAEFSVDHYCEKIEQFIEESDN